MAGGKRAAQNPDCLQLLERAIDLGREPLAIALLARAQRLMGDSPDVWALAAAYAYWSGRVGEAAEKALKATQLGTTFRSAFWAARTLEWRDPLLSEKYFRLAVGLAEEASDWPNLARASAGLARNLALQAAYPEAAGLARWALDLCERLPECQKRETTYLEVVRAYSETGLLSAKDSDLGVLEEHLQRALSRAYRVRSVYTRPLWLQRFYLALSRGEVSEAAQYLKRATRFLRSRVAAMLFLIPEVRLALEGGAGATEVVRATRPLAQGMDSVFSRYHVLAEGMAAVIEVPERAVAYLEEARTRFQNPLNAVELARATLYLAGAYQLLGDARSARRVLAEAGKAVEGLSDPAVRALVGPSELRPRLARSGGLELYFMGGLKATRFGQAVPLSLRQAELLVALLAEGRPLSAAELAARVWERPVSDVVVRNQIARLRLHVRLDSNPYRVLDRVWADFLEIPVLLREGRLARALALYRPPLLPTSTAPVVEEWRVRLREEVKRAVMETADPHLLLRLADIEGDDPELWEAAARAWPRGSVCRGLAEGRLRAALGDEDRSPSG